MVILGDDFWGTFTTGPLGNVEIKVNRRTRTYRLEGADQLGNARPQGAAGDIGAIEQ